MKLPSDQPRQRHLSIGLIRCLEIPVWDRGFPPKHLQSRISTGPRLPVIRWQTREMSRVKGRQHKLGTSVSSAIRDEEGLPKVEKN
jgi:hypothetical protein